MLTAILAAISGLITAVDQASDIYNYIDKSRTISQLNSLKKKVSSRNIADQTALRKLNEIISSNNISMQLVSPQIRSILKDANAEANREVNKLENRINERLDAVDQATDYVNASAGQYGIGGAIAKIKDNIEGGQDYASRISKIEQTLK